MIIILETQSVSISAGFYKLTLMLMKMNPFLCEKVISLYSNVEPVEIYKQLYKQSFFSKLWDKIKHIFDKLVNTNRDNI